MNFFSNQFRNVVKVVIVPVFRNKKGCSSLESREAILRSVLGIYFNRLNKSMALAFCIHMFINIIAI